MDFNAGNHTIFRLPLNELNSPSFGQIFTAGAPQVFQFVVKLSY